MILMAKFFPECPDTLKNSSLPYEYVYIFVLFFALAVNFFFNNFLPDKQNFNFHNFCTDQSVPISRFLSSAYTVDDVKFFFVCYLKANDIIINKNS